MLGVMFIKQGRSKGRFQKWDDLWPKAWNSRPIKTMCAGVGAFGSPKKARLNYDQQKQRLIVTFSQLASDGTSCWWRGWNEMQGDQLKVETWFKKTTTCKHTPGMEPDMIGGAVEPLKAVTCSSVFSQLIIDVSNEREAHYSCRAVVHPEDAGESVPFVWRQCRHSAASRKRHSTAHLSFSSVPAFYPWFIFTAMLFQATRRALSTGAGRRAVMPLCSDVSDAYLSSRAHSCRFSRSLLLTEASCVFVAVAPAYLHFCVRE